MGGHPLAAEPEPSSMVVGLTSTYDFGEPLRKYLRLHDSSSLTRCNTVRLCVIQYINLKMHITRHPRTLFA